MNSERKEPRMSRGSLFWRLWFRSLVVRRPQAIVAITALLVGAAIASMLLNLYSDVRRKTTEEFRSYGANVILSANTAESSRPASTGDLMDEAAFGRLESLQPKIKGLMAAPVLYVVVRLSREAADSRQPAFENAVAAGTNFAALHALIPGWRITAGDPGQMVDSGSCAVGSHLAERFRLKPGDVLTVSFASPNVGVNHQTSDFRVKQVVSTGASEDDQVFVPLADLQRLAGLAGKISLIEMNIPGETAQIEQGVRQVTSAFPELRVQPLRQVVYSQGRVLGTIRWLLISLMILILAIITLCVMGTMAAIVLERRKDIAVMKALGASNHEVMRLLVTEGASLGLVAGLAGFAAGAVLASRVAERLFGVSLNLVWWTLPLVSISTILLAALATFLSVGMMRRIQPASAIKGE